MFETEILTNELYDKLYTTIGGINSEEKKLSFQKEIFYSVDSYLNGVKNKGLTSGKVKKSIEKVEKTTAKLLKQLRKLSPEAVGVISGAPEIDEPSDKQLNNDKNYSKAITKVIQYEQSLESLENFSGLINRASDKLKDLEGTDGPNKTILYQLINDFTKIAKNYAIKKPKIRYYKVKNKLSGNLAEFITLLLEAIFDGKYKNRISNIKIDLYAKESLKSES
jgi:hypothetical protein